MAGRIALPPMSEERNSAVLPLGIVNRLLDAIEEPLMVAERSGSLLLVNTRARQCLGFHGYAEIQGLNLFNDILQVDSKKIFGELERGQHEVNLNIDGGKRNWLRGSSGCQSRTGWWWKLKANQKRIPGRIPPRNSRCKNFCKSERLRIGIFWLHI